MADSTVGDTTVADSTMPHLNIFKTPRVKVNTTRPRWPVIPNKDRPPIRTRRVLIRAPLASDIDAIYEMRRQPEVMLYTARGFPDTCIADSQVFLDKYLAPNDAHTYYFTVLYLGEDGEIPESEAPVIGACGVHGLDQSGFWFGWPEIGYSLRKEYWNKGLATEVLVAYLQAFWALPREAAEMEVHPATVGEAEDGKVPEQVTALVGALNPASLRVLEKLGFETFKKWEEFDNRPSAEGAAQMGMWLGSWRQGHAARCHWSLVAGRWSHRSFSTEYLQPIQMPTI
ncbi:acyl-CoA N-acyltransferase [Xylariaceae sp. FL1272]|nr:acyl-CoA N-acyltransferase [Xylariaceae sp. FL1272]